MPGIDAEKVIGRLARGESLAAIVLLGTDPYLREMCRNNIVEACVPESARVWAVARLSAREAGWDDILQRARTMPMLSPRQVIIVEGAESIEKLGDESRGKILDALGEYLQSPSPFTILLIEAAELDGRQKFFKLLSEKGLIVTLTIGEASAASLAAQMAKDLGAEIDPGAASLLADIMNREPGRIRIELEKLAAYAQGRGRITTADVEELVVAARKNTVWQLADILAARNRNAAFAFLDNVLREGEAPAGIVGVLAWMYRKLIEASDLPKDTKGFQAVRHLGMRPGSAEAAVRNAHRIPKSQLLDGLVALAEADSQLKSGNPNPRAVTEFLIARLTSSPSQ